jgi:SAM-dependent methyltransferase
MAHYSFYASKKISSPGAVINHHAAKKLAEMCTGILGSTFSGDRCAVLEIGPGKGMFASFLTKSKNIEYEAYEPEPSLFAMLKEMGLNVKKQQVPPIPDENEQFHAIAMLNILEHLPSIQVTEALFQECRRVLRPNGILFIVVPNYLDWGKQFYNLDYTHQTIYTESRLRNILSDNGFSMVRIAYHYGCFFSGIGRIFNAGVRLFQLFCSVLLPRSLSRSEKVQKMSILFAENIICITRKEKMPESVAA